MGWLFFIFWILITPLIVWNGYYEGPKVFTFLILGLTLSIFWIYRLIKKSQSLNLNKKDYWFLAWLFVLTVSSLFGIHPMDSVLGGSYRHQGVIFFLALWLVGKTISTMSDKKKILLSKGLALTILIEVLIVLGQFIFGKLYFGKPLGTLGETNAVAGMLAMGSFFIVYQKSTLLLFTFLAVLVTSSKIGIFSFVINLVPLITKKLNRKFVFLSAAILIVTSLVVGYSVLGNKIKYIFTPFDQLWKLGQEERVVVWRMALDKIIEKPILGWGAESTEAVMAISYGESAIPLFGLIIDRAHNLFLDILLWSGTLGLIPFIGWLYTIYKDLGSDRKKFAFASFLIYSMFQPLSIVHWILIIIIVNI